MRCFTPGARTQPATAITACAVLENAYFTAGARTQPTVAFMACAVLGIALFYAWSKNTAGNSNYDLRGAGECCLVPITRFERTQLRIELWCW